MDLTTHLFLLEKYVLVLPIKVVTAYFSPWSL